MSERSFDKIIRSAILMAYDYTCFYCGRPLEWDSLQIDHIIPEQLGNNFEAFEALTLEYGLNPDFDLNGLCNLVPVHASCNSRKGGQPYSKSTTLHFLEQSARKISVVEKEIQKARSEKRRIITSSKLHAALAANMIELKDVEAILKEVKKEQWDNKRIAIPMPIEFIDQVFDSFYLNTDCSLLYDKKVLLGQSFYGLELQNGRKEKILVSTLREWKDAKQKGFSAYTTLAMKMSDSFTFLDELISALHKARMPKVSFLNDPWLEIDNMDMLSPSFLWSRDGRQPPFNASTSVGDLIRKGIVKRNESYKFKIALEWSHSEYLLIEQFRADFNHDGIEDIFVRGWTRAVGGSFGMGFTSVFTRLSDKHLIELTRIGN